MTESKHNRIKAIGFGGLLNIKYDTLLARLENWLMVGCFDAESSQLVLPGRGVIKVTAEALQSIMDLPNNGDEVKYELDVNAIDFIQAKYKIARGKAPRIGAIILYVDSLLVENVDIPATMPRIAAWSRSLVDQVVKLDTNRDGSFGKLKLKSSVHTVIQSSLFQLDDVRRFMSSKVSSNMSDEKKRKLTTAVSEFCASFTNLMGTFLEKVSEIEEPSSTTSSHGDDESDDDEEDDNEYDGTDEEEETTGEYSCSENTKEESDPLEDGGTPPPDFDYLVDGMFIDNISEDEHSSQDHVPLIARLRRMRKGTKAENQDKGSDKHSSPPVSPDGKSLIHSSPKRAKDDERPAEPQPLAYILPENLKKVGIAHNRQSKLRLPSNPVEQKDTGDGATTATLVHNVGEGYSFKVPSSKNIVQQETGSAAKMDPLDFTPPDFTLFDEDNISSTKSAGGFGGATCSLDEIPEEEFQKLEDDAIKENESRKRKALIEEHSSGKLSVTPAITIC
ncbi:unnamed protein product [Miscanthus lutarioriparius]|uniref:Uncharacterized protein n=1 Tax=Miscanthus lutarioriparius TaxID=422564 RepID=A0A811S241_9POAL|nr:unnamed protein product [Miscanthus lutarioriparius]